MTIFQIYPKDILNREFLNIVKKTNLIDYIVDIRKRLNLGSEIPEELSQKRALVLATLQDLNVESEPITKVIDLMDDSDNIKDSATFINKLQKDYGVSESTRRVERVRSVKSIILVLFCSTNQSG